MLRVATTTSRNDKIELIVKNLPGRGQSRPRKLKTLANLINSLFPKKVEEAELLSLIDELKERGYMRSPNARSAPSWET